MARPIRLRESYSIGIICALDVEKAAVEASIDEEHGRVEKQAGDDNVYSFGRIGVHNVVIACLPAGVAGKASAAAVARDMMRSFPIKVGLMVGICGGVWSEKTDIRLGDVVVSQPDGMHGGVVQWDFGKMEKEGVFRRTGTLNKPPRPLLNAVQSLKAKHLRKGSDIARYLEEMLANNPFMVETFRFQGRQHDKLFEASYMHASGDTCDGCDRTRLVQRSSERKDNKPRIYYGNIASGDEVVKDGLTRDRIALIEGIICFEMEAAGLIETFPCIVIRGVCDYADSHKNKRWQPYAAAVAACYAKELLEEVDQQGIDELGLARAIPFLQDLGLRKEIMTRLGDIRQTVWEFTNRQKEVQMDERHRECLRDLRVVNPQDDLQRIENEKEALIASACKWIFEDDKYANFTNWDGPSLPQDRLLWIKGHAGTGKTMLLIGIIRELSIQPAAHAPSLSYFFCQGTDTTLNTAVAILRSLMWMLVVQQPHLMSHLQVDYGYSRKALFTDKNALVALSRIFRQMLEDMQPVCFVVDALDECVHGMTDLIDLISTSLKHSNKVRWLFSSRPDSNIFNMLQNMDTKTAGIPTTLAQIDIELQKDRAQKYIEHKLLNLKDSEVGSSYSAEIMATITIEVRRRANNNFLWLSLVFNDLRWMRGPYAVRNIKDYHTGLSKLYDQKLTQIENSETEHWRYCGDVLTAASLAFRPLSLSELAEMVPWSDDIDPYRIVRRCDSFLNANNGIVNLNHKSAKDYLENHPNKLQRSTVRGHADVFKHSIDAMTSTLKRDIYNLRHCGVELQDIVPPATDVLVPIRYYCVFWLSHLCEAINDSPADARELCDGAFEFLKLHYLHWLESLCLLNNLSDGIISIRDFLNLVQLSNYASSELVEFLRDAERFAVSFRSIIERAPLQIYSAGLTFCPIDCEMFRHLRDQKFYSIPTLTNTIRRWDPCLQTLKGHERSVNAVAFSSDGKMLASASSDRTVKLWDGVTGSFTKTLQAHSAYVLDIAFAPNSYALASASKDLTVRLWDVATGTCTNVLEGHSDWVNAVAFSPCGKMLASASNDLTIRLWDGDLGWHDNVRQYKSPLTGHSDLVLMVAFSPNGILASASKDGTIRLWDVTQRTCERRFDVKHCINSIAFSHDGNLLAAASSAGIVQLYKLDTADEKRLWGHSGCVNAVAFSRDGILASASNDRTVRLWDTALYICKETLGEHTGWVNAIAFSSKQGTIASASSDRTVRIWNSTIQAERRTVNGHSNAINAIAFSPDGKLLATASNDRTAKLWDAGTNTCRETLSKSNGSILAVAFSHDGNMLAMGSSDRKIWLWDVETSTYIGSLKGHRSYVSAVAFCPRYQLLASASNDQTTRIWDVENRSCINMLDGYDDWIRAVVFSSDGKRLASASENGMVQLWDTIPLGIQLRDAWASAARQPSLRFEIEQGLKTISFSVDSQYLKTNRGSCSVPTPTMPPLESHDTSLSLNQYQSTVLELLRPPYTPDLETMWDNLRAELDNIMNNWDKPLNPRTFMSIYTIVHNFLNSRPVQDGNIYQRLSDYLTNHLQRRGQELKIHHDKGLLAMYAQEWEHFESAAKRIDRLFRYLNGRNIQRLIDEGHKDVFFVYDLHLVKWRSVLFDSISDRVVQSVIKLIERQRNGEAIGYDYIKKFVDSLTLGCQEEDFYGLGLDVYRLRFQHPFVDATVQFYQAESQRLAHDSVVEYMKRAERRLIDEQRLWTCLHLQTSNTLENAFNQALIANRYDHLCNTFPILLDGDCEEDMERAFKLLSRIGRDSDMLRKFQTHLQKPGLATVAQAASHIENLKPTAFSGIVRPQNQGFDKYSGDENPASDIYLTEDWIAQGGENLLHLPSNYRITSAALCKDVLALGHASGQISFFKLSG